MLLLFLPTCHWSGRSLVALCLGDLGSIHHSPLISPQGQTTRKGSRMYTNSRTCCSPRFPSRTGRCFAERVIIFDLSYQSTILRTVRDSTSPRGSIMGALARRTEHQTPCGPTEAPRCPGGLGLCSLPGLCWVLIPLGYGGI